MSDHTWPGSDGPPANKFARAAEKLATLKHEVDDYRMRSSLGRGSKQVEDIRQRSEIADVF